MADQSNYNMDYGAIAQAGAQILGASMNAAIAAQTSERDRKFNTRVRAENRKWALEDYARMLEDSSPRAQVERLKAGGLNPNLVYGSGNIQTGVVSTPRSADMPDSHVRPFQLDLAALNVLGNILGAQMQKAQIKKTEAEATKAEAEAKKAESETSGQDLANDFAQRTMDIRVALESNRNYEVLTNIRKMDADIRNQSFLTDSQIRLNNTQIENLTQARFVQWEELELSREQIGAQIKQGFMHAQAALKSASAAQLNAAGNYLKASSDAVRNSKLNELTNVQIGTMALENRRLQNDMQYDSERLQFESEKREAIQRRNAAWNKNFGWTGLSFDDFRSLIPFAPSIEHTTPNPSTGGATKWKF